MSRSDRAHAMHERFATQFLYPLVSGDRPAVIGRPVPPGIAEDVAQLRPADPAVDDALFDVLHAHASSMVPVEALPYPEHGAVALGMALHNLASLTDPAMTRAVTRRARPTILQWTDELIDMIEPPCTRGEVLARHAVVSRALLLRRADVVVTNWAGTFYFSGRPVPPRITAWPRLRRVREQRAEQEVIRLWRADPKLATRLRAILARSPMTELTRLDLASGLRFGVASLSTLADPALRGAVSRALAAQGLGRIAAPMGRALEALAQGDAPASVRAPALALMWELHATAAIQGDADIAWVAGSWHGALFAAVAHAMLERPAATSALAIPELAAADRERMSAWASTLAAQAGEQALDHARELVPHGPSSASEHDEARS